MPKVINIEPGEKFKSWTVIKFFGIDSKNRQKMYQCQCECGEISVLFSGNLRTKSGSYCCLKCTHKKAQKSSTTHGLYGSRVHQSWVSMKSRCNNTKGESYHNYGGRGIKVCERWLVFKNFLEDMGMPALNHQLDRIDPDGDYEPYNCRWVTAKDNNNNRRNSKQHRGEYTYVKIKDLCKLCCDKIHR